MPQATDDSMLDEVGARAAHALEAGEDAGEFDYVGMLLSLGKLVDRRALVAGAIDYWAELAKIVVGVSDVAPDPRDWRFKDDAWRNNALYKRIGQSYVAFCNAAQGIFSDDTDWRVKERARFLVEVTTSTLAPTNTLIGNPAAMKRAVETKGRSLLDGFGNFVGDLRDNGGMPTMVDASPFIKGKNVAATPGSVVFRNELLELIQYRPATDTVHAIPMLVIPPQINKYYFTDLAPGRSLVEFAVGKGMRMFVVSWRNPHDGQGDWNLDTYTEALLEALDTINSITDSKKINAIGFCAGGITLAALLGYMESTGDKRMNTASFAVTLLDWSTPSTVGMLHSRSLIELTKRRSARKGIVSGKDLGNVFAWFRPNDLVWNYWVNNYLMGNKPPSFDILAWNADATNLPAALHAQFLDIFLDNSLAKAGTVEVLGRPLNLRDISIDTYVMGARADHLTPWQGCYRATQQLGGDSTFVLSNAGHIASLVNPPGNPKASYCEGSEPGEDCDAWLSEAVERSGSWWEHWIRWTGERSGRKVAAGVSPGNDKFPALEAAPGTYIHG